ncbi:amidase [Paenibacillus sp. sgz500958]|uniref:amidase n=1 Tax=Paenibacillus sp. sgz500958 TaxID=3242475 RepID=UPI0036D311A2
MDNRYGAYIAPELEVPPQGEGVLDGFSFTVKDVFAVAGHSSSAGNPDWLSSHPVHSRNAAVITKLLQSGAALKGAAHTDELMYSLGGENVHYGTPANPRAPGRIPGGSSSGSAVAVASGSVDFALGTDTGGSIRVPSSYCGIYGFRPTHGAVEMDGIIPLAPSFDTAGWMAGDVALLRKVGEVLITPPSGGDCVRRTGHPAEGNTMDRIIVATDAWALAGTENLANLQAGLEVLRRGSLGFEEVDIAPEGLKSWMDTFRELQGAEIWAAHGEWIGRTKPRFGPDIAARFTWASGLAVKDLSHMQQLRQEITFRLHRLLGEQGCLIIPTVPGPAPLPGGDSRQLELNRSGAMMLCCIAGLAGLPQVTLPVKGDDGLPLGLSVIGGHGQDLRLLSWIEEFWE